MVLYEGKKKCFNTVSGQSEKLEARLSHSAVLKFK